MTRFLLSCHFLGQSFSPALAERTTGISFSSKNEPGELGTTGRYAGQPRPYGAATLTVDEHLPWPTKLDSMVELLARNIDKLREFTASLAIARGSSTVG